MTNRDVALLAFKLVGFFLMTVAAIVIVAFLLSGSRRNDDAATTLAPALVLLGIGVSIWFSAGSLAAHIFPGAPPDLQGDRLRGDALFALALSVMGTFFVCVALPEVARGITLFVQSRTAVFGPDEHIWNPTAKANAVAAVVRLLTGVALLAGRAGLGALVARVRNELRGTLVADEEDIGEARTAEGDAEQADAAGEALPRSRRAGEPRS